MSFKFDSTLSQFLNGTLTTALNETISLFAFCKHVDHGAVLQGVIGIGETTGSASHVSLRYSNTTERYTATTIDTTPTTSSASYDDSVQDNTWFGVVGVFSAEDSRVIYVRQIGNTASNTESRTTNAMGVIRVGRTMGGSAYYGAASPNESKLAEIGIVAGSTPTTQQITDYLAGTALSSLGFGTDLKLYVSMATNSLVNTGSDALASLTNNNAAVYDSDHPIITTGSAPSLYVTRGNVRLN